MYAPSPEACGEAEAALLDHYRNNTEDVDDVELLMDVKALRKAVANVRRKLKVQPVLTNPIVAWDSVVGTTNSQNESDSDEEDEGDSYSKR